MILSASQNVDYLKATGKARNNLSVFKMLLGKSD